MRIIEFRLRIKIGLASLLLRGLDELPLAEMLKRQRYNIVLTKKVVSFVRNFN